MTHICASKLTIIGFRQWLVARTAPSHYLNQWWNIINRTLRNKLQWNFERNSNIFIKKNALENGVCEMASILSRPQCVNSPVAEWFSWNIIMYQHFTSILKKEMVPVAEKFHCQREKNPAKYSWSVSRELLLWQCSARTLAWLYQWFDAKEK